jgi:hypothetical protein
MQELEATLHDVLARRTFDPLGAGKRGQGKCEEVSEMDYFGQVMF